MAFLIIQTDFGTGSLSVSAMHGVCAMVDPGLKVDDGNNDVAPFNVLDASDSLMYLMPYWPDGTVFVSVERGAAVWQNLRMVSMLSLPTTVLLHISRRGSE